MRFRTTLTRSATGSFVLALVFSIVLSLLAVSSPAIAEAPAPTNLQATGAPVPTLSWDVQPSSERYRVQGSEDSTFASLLFNEETTSNRYTPTRLFRAGTLHWRVQATDPTGTGPFSTSSTLIAPPAVPVGLSISSPTGAVLPPVSPPIIAWKPVAGATSYEVEMDDEGDGIGGDVRGGIRTTTYVWPEPQGVGERAGTEDFWVRVRAQFDNQLQSAWSAYVKYDVAQLPPVTSSTCATGLVCAPDAATGVVLASRTVQDVVFDWDPVKGAKQYEIWVALDRDFNNQVEKRIVFSTRYSPPATYDNGNYFWKVRSYNAVERPTPWPATPSEFQRRWPYAPSLLYPANSSASPVGDDLFFQWSPVKHATRYVLEIGTDPNFSPGSFRSCTTASTTYTPGYGGDECMPAQGLLYYWHVRAFDEPGGNGAVGGLYSAVSEFVYETARVQQQSPASNATVSVPTMTWAPATDAEKYRVTITSADGTSRTRETSALSWTPTDALPTDSDAVDPGQNPDPFTWSVEARDANGAFSPLYPGRTFYLTEGPITAGASPLTPQAVAHQPVLARFPGLSWQPYPSTVDAPVYYMLRVSETPGFVVSPGATEVLSTRLAYPAVTDWGDYFLTPRERTWWVDVYSAATNQKLATGSSSTFTIGAPGAVSGQQVALDGKAINAGNSCTKRLVVGDEQTVCQGLPATPVLDWAPVAGAGGYMIYLSEDPDFTNLLLSPESTTTQNSRWTPSFRDSLRALDDNESGPAFFWFIRPCVSINPFRNCGPDPRGRLDAGTSAFRKVSPKVVLSQPADGSRFADEISFSWQDYYDTNQATPSPYGGLPSHQTAKRYRIQVAPSATITDANAIDDRVVDQATYTNFDNTYPEGDLWWRVQAIDAQDHRLAWSDTRKIIKATPALNLDPGYAAPVERPTVDPTARPAFGTHVSAGPVVFQWSAETFDATWNLELYKNDDTTLSSANRVFSESVRQAAFASTDPLAPSSEPYRWRVQRIDVRGKPGQWSDFGRFWVDPLPVTLGQPADGATVDPNGTLFTWEPYPTTATAQAARYTFDIEPVGGVGQNPGPVNTTATSWSPTSVLTTGTYDWSVLAFDARGNRLGSSPTRRFQVDGAVRALAPTQIQAPSGTGIGSTLTSTPPTWSQSDVAMTYVWRRDGQDMGNATSATYTLTLDDFNKVITLKVVGRRPGYTDGVSISNGITATAGGALVPTAQPLITGTAKVGETLHVSTGTWSVSGASYKFQWARSGVPIPGATGDNYTLKPEDAARSISATVLASRVGYTDGGATAAPVTVAKMASTTAAAFSATQVKAGKRVKISIVVRVNGVPGPTGVIKVYDGAKVLKSLTLAPTRAGKIGWKLPVLKVGKHKIKAVYAGNGSTAGSKSTVTKVYVVH